MNASAKPIDLGTGSVTASLGSDGRWLSLGTADRRHGYVELNALPRFRDRWRGDPDAVRRYRRWMAEDRFAFLRLEVLGGGEAAPAHELGADGVARWGLARAGGPHRVIAWADPGAGGILQRHTLRLAPGGPGRCELRFGGRLGVHPTPEITEAGPAGEPPGPTRLSARGLRLGIAAPPLDARAEIRVSGRGARLEAWRADDHGARLTIERLDARAAAVELLIECRLGEPGGAARAAPSRAPAATPAPAPERRHPAGAVAPIHAAAPAPSAPPVPEGMRDAVLLLARRAWSYVAGCTALRVVGDAEEVCIVTDHRVLPLSWTRDAYYQALLLLALDTPDGVARRLVAGHLRWLWARCRRPRGLWMRSHRPDGAARDLRYQADQQLFPLLELADYHRATGELPRPPRGAGGASRPASWWSGRVGELLAALPIAPSGLLPTEENPADDPAALPFALSTQILCWYAARRLTELGLDLDVEALGERARRAVAEHFVAEGPFGPQWAYEVDGAGRRRLYQDANDLPTALAPLLGFCSPGDPLWRATMSFALSARNPGFSPGPWGGLGSLHTPGTWTLGDIQEWVAASALGDPERSARALARLVAVASPDGMLPEAYDSATGTAPVRLWFAWPGAALGALVAGAITPASRSGPRRDRQPGDRRDQLRPA
ncbi:MAG: metal-independent alpha-mannosidase [Solirubrobacterales bacterium]|nr:metal-independent alpha-mannosidase [Solirubrobacterales bacterium]